MFLSFWEDSERLLRGGGGLEGKKKERKFERDNEVAIVVFFQFVDGKFIGFSVSGFLVSISHSHSFLCTFSF